MARYIVTSGTQFTPFTYDELVRPLAQMTEAHNEAQAMSWRQTRRSLNAISVIILMMTMHVVFMTTT